jgi:hypothetical protein
MSLMYRTLAGFGLLDRVRLYGFDSFEGYPKEAAEETTNPYMPGMDKSPERIARRVLSERGIDWSRVEPAKGWFSDTLTPDFLAREKIERVSLVNFDCDLYLSTKQALSFVGPLVGASAVFFMDDWGDEELINRKKAFVEFLEAHPDIYAEELPNYSWESRVFYIYRGASDPAWQRRMKMLT